MKRPVTVFLVLTLAALTGLFFARSPWRQLELQKAEHAKKLAQTRKIESERAELMQENARLQSPFGMEERARELGYHKPYEQPLTVE